MERGERKKQLAASSRQQAEDRDQGDLLELLELF
jgi:hypothetical protein